ncbi:ROK family protein [Lewinella sp. IMCC34183]|uniref:ROK family protein n=1 Tax=Lewinella sp. IMCC34183 TaxID=2248762 RepID=UPI000E222083|nr:ROK family protein [Lewinella sp. IMCC34183]
MNDPTPAPRILILDLGGSHLKGTVLDAAGNEVAAYQSLPTPRPATPDRVLDTVGDLIKQLGAFDYLSMGFPGYVRHGLVQTAPNLGSESWAGVNLQDRLAKRFGRPARVVNDADLLGLGIAAGDGLELLVTLGTGFGTACLLDGVLLPHLELAHHPLREEIDYDQYVGEAELERIGPEAWNVRMREVVDILDTVFHYDTLWLAGGNARLITFDAGPRAKLSNNRTGIRGGYRLWSRETGILTH